ncbi:MAG: adenine deaminase [Candidatus Borkfalkiaceae bacterium]|nr:adenine deaminase [Christensenellaceae bacterium]
MINRFCKRPLEECTEKLAAVATGREKADLVIRGAKIVNVCTREILSGRDVAVTEGRIALVGNAEGCIGENTKIVDAKGKYLAPAFMDGHMHVESSMLTAHEFARVAIAHGTSGIFFDPHEICNVLGLDGVRYMLEDAAGTPLKAMLTTPSCVPAVPGFEDTGAEIHPADVAGTMKWKECVGLGEMMNFPGILASDPHTHAIVGETLKSGKIVTGHYSVPDTGAGLNAYVASGVRCCHESTTEESALEKMRLGMYAMLREGSAWHDLQEVAKAITRHEVDSRFACLISDDTHPHTLVDKGHLDHIVRRAIEEGIDPVVAIQMVTINVAQCFRLDHELGSVAPSKCADFVLLTDLKTCAVDEVFSDGELVAKGGKTVVPFTPYVYPAAAYRTVRCRKITEEDLRIPAEGEVRVHAVEVIGGKVGTIDRLVSMTARNGELSADGEKDLMKACVIDRHHENGSIGKGFVKGFGIRAGALAQTVAHDAHNLFVVGTDDRDMVLAANTLVECGGGLVAVRDGKILGLVPLPIAGLMSDRPLEETEEKVLALENAWKELGCTLPSPFMTMAIIPLACLPEVRLTNRGLVDCRTFRFLDLIEK